MSRVRCLFVAEKPSIARTLTEVLSKGGSRTRASVSKTNPCFDFDLDVDAAVDPSLPGGGRRLSVTVTSVRGHVMSMDFENKATKNWRRTAHREMFDAAIERIVTPGLEDVAKNLKNEAARAQVLVIWTDCDREGEAIGEEILLQCRESNPRIRCKRARFSAANAPDLWKAVNTLRELNMYEVDAVLARQEIDLRLGAVFTRFQTISLGDRVNALDGKIVSFGPCQFPTLGFIVARYEAILAFQKETFWQIKMSHSTVQTQVTPGVGGQQMHQQPSLFHFNWGRFRLFDQALATVCFDMCSRHPEATVTEVTRRPTFKRKPLPLSTVELQVRGSNWLKLDSETIMRAAESLYQRGIISYPRTETEVFSDTFDLRAILGEFRSSTVYGEHIAKLLDMEGFEHPRNGSKNDEAHPPIHPLKWVDNLTELPEVRVYEFVCRHFLACCSKDAVGSESTVKVNIAAETFTAKGLVVHERNFLDVYVYERWGEKSIPDLREGDKFIPTKIDLVSGETTPPDLLTEADLIRLMDKNGIGTDATIQDHIKTVLERDYATKLPEKQNRFAPSNLGVALVRAYNQMGHELEISRPELRSQIERDLTKICRGEKSRADVVKSTVDKYREVYLDVLRKRETLIQQVEDIYLGFDSLGINDRFDRLLASNVSKCGTCGHVSTELVQASQDSKLGLRCANSSCAEFGNVLQPLPAPMTSGNGSILNSLMPRQDGFCCPICSYQVFTISSAADRSWSFCPRCFTRPPPEATMNGNDMEDLASMPCFKCAKADCQLAGNTPEVTVLPCGDCRGTHSLVLKRRQPPESTFYLRCGSYPQCKGSSRLPKCAKDITLAQPSSPCAKCGALKLLFQFDRAKVPPGTPLAMVECPNFVHCDSHSIDFRTILEMENLHVALNSNRNNNSMPIGMNAQPRPAMVQNTSRVASSASTSSQPPRSIPRPSFSTNSVPSFSTASAIPAYNGSTAYSAPIQPSRAFPRPFADNTSSAASNPRFSTSTASTGVCKKCGQVLQERVSKTASNPGRIFYKCDPCNTFEWADGQQQQGPQPTINHASSSFPARTMASNTSYGRGPPSVSASSYGQGCYHCGSKDHFPVACPTLQHHRGTSVAARGSNANDVCFKCNQPGHWSNQCPGTGNAQGARSYGAGQSAGFTKQRNPRGAPRHGNGFNGGAKKQRSCAQCFELLPPRKRVCENCGTSTVTRRSGKGAAAGRNGLQDDDDDEMDDILD